MQQSLFPIYYTAVTCCLQRPPIKSRRISDSPFYIKLQTSNLKRSLRRRRRIQLLSVRSNRLRCSYSLSTWNRSSGRRWIRYSWLRHSCRRRPMSWCCSRRQECPQGQIQPEKKCPGWARKPNLVLHSAAGIVISIQSISSKKPLRWRCSDESSRSRL